MIEFEIEWIWNKIIWHWAILELIKFEKDQIWNRSNLKLIKFEIDQIWNWSNLKLVEFEIDDWFWSLSILNSSDLKLIKVKFWWNLKLIKVKFW